MSRRILNLFIAIDQLLYVLITLGRGSPDETLSAAAWRLEQEGKIAGKLFRPLIDTIFWFDHQHCLSSYKSELERAQLYLATKKDTNA